MVRTSSLQKERVSTQQNQEKIIREKQRQQQREKVSRRQQSQKIEKLVAYEQADKLSQEFAAENLPLREAIILSEIIGQPRCRSRYRRR